MLSLTIVLGELILASIFLQTTPGHRTYTERTKDVQKMFETSTESFMHVS